MADLSEVLIREFGEDAAKKFSGYADLLLSANNEFNLTGLKEREAVLEELFYDTAVLSKFLSPEKYELSGQLIDIGSGAGIPGVPLAVLYPQLKFVLVEAIKKKSLFISSACQKIHLANVGVMCERSEIMAHSPLFRGLFDFAASKAVGELAELVELALPFLKLNGVLFAYKGPNAPEEIESAKRALKELHAEVCDLFEYSLPSGPKRTIVCIRKNGVSPEHYPRRPGMPHKRPL